MARVPVLHGIRRLIAREPSLRQAVQVERKSRPARVCARQRKVAIHPPRQLGGRSRGRGLLRPAAPEPAKGWNSRVLHAGGDAGASCPRYRRSRWTRHVPREGRRRPGPELVRSAVPQSMASRALRSRLARMRCSCSGSAHDRTPATDLASEPHTRAGSGRRPRPQASMRRGAAAGHQASARRCSRAAIGQHVGSARATARSRARSSRGRALGHAGVAADWAMRSEAILGAGQHVAQIMVDLGHRLAERRQPSAGVQRHARRSACMRSRLDLRRGRSRRGSSEGSTRGGGSSGSARKRSHRVQVIRCIGRTQKGCSAIIRR